jgi:hypothetical protein
MISLLKNMLSHVNPHHKLTLSFFEINLNLSSHPNLGLPSDLNPPVFRLKLLIFPYNMRATYPPHLSYLHWITLMLCRKQAYKLQGFSLCGFLHEAYLLNLNILSKIFCPNPFTYIILFEWDIKF